MSIDKYQLEQVEKLRSGEMNYQSVPIYTILLELSLNNDIKEIQTILHNVAHELEKRTELENLFDELKKYKWS